MDYKAVDVVSADEEASQIFIRPVPWFRERYAAHHENPALHQTASNKSGVRAVSTSPAVRRCLLHML